MKLKRFKSVVYFLVICYSSSYAGYRANFLSHGPSAAAFGRGETVFAGDADVSASFYNPAHLAEMEQNNINLAHFMLFEGSIYNYAGAGLLLGNNCAAGLSVVNLRSGGIEIRKHLNDAPETAFAGQTAFIGSFAMHIEKFYGLNAGINIKYLHLGLYGYSGKSAAADFGLSGDFSGPNVFGKESKISVGAAVQNLIQPSFRLISEEERYERIYLIETAFSVPLTFIYKPGMKNLYFDNLALLASFVNEENRKYIRCGAEYRALNTYFLRAGIYADHITAGLGFRTRVNWRVDYAADISAFSLFHRMGFTYSFGRHTSGNALNETQNIRVPEGNTLLKEALLKQEDDRKERQALETMLSPEMKGIKKDIKGKKYLKATDRLKELILVHPEYEPAVKLHNAVSELMAETAKNANEPDFEEIAYAKGYFSYYKNNMGDALNQWEKVSAIDPNRAEIAEYILKTKTLLSDAEARLKEKESEENVSAIFEQGVKHYENGKWVQCIRKMEKAKKTCELKKLRSSVEWMSKADTYIKNSVDGLSKSVLQNQDTLQDTEREKEIDFKAADKKYDQGLILYAQGKLSIAAKMWEIALRFNPAHEKAKQALEKVRQELNEGKKVN
ncbi:MAG: hypothetical protein ABII64_07065 [Elusimicrobiota bacterium]